MMIRRYTDDDLNRVKEIFAQQNFEYDFPEIETFLDTHTFVDDGKVVMALGAQPTADMYLLADNTWGTPGMRFEVFKTLHNTMEKSLIEKGIIQVHAWLPPGYERHFGRRLMNQFGWTKPMWTPYARVLGR